MLFMILSLMLGDTRVGNLPPYQWPADKYKSAAIGPSGTIAWRDDGSMKNAALDCPGVDPTGMTYSDVGINDCIAAAGPSGGTWAGGGLYFPKGVYKLQNPINLTRRMLITGDGMMATWFYPDPGVTGMIIHYPCEDGHTGCDLPRGDLTVIQDIGFEYALNASAWVPNQGVGLGYVAHGSNGPSNLSLTNVYQVTAAGTTASTEPTWGSSNEGDFITDGSATWQAIEVACIRFNSRASVKNVMCDRSSGNGILIQASTPEKNANSWFLDNVYLQQAVLNGMYVQGADTNAGIGIAVHSGSNRLWGIYDNSFLGNTYTGCSTEANGLGGYGMVGVAATNVLNGCYSEGGQPESRLEGFSMSFGGLHGAGFSSTSGGMRASPGNRFETNGSSITFRDLNAPSGAQINMPYAGDYLMNITNDVEGVVGFTVQAGNTTTNQGWWNWRHANLDGRSFMRWGGTNADAPYSIWFPHGLHLGNRIFLDALSSAPSWSAYPEFAGSFAFNTSQFPQNGTNNGIFGWQQHGNSTTVSEIFTVRWPQFGVANEKTLTANPSGTPYNFNYVTDSGLMFTNAGATAKQYIQLPTQAFNPDLRYTELYLQVDDADGMRVTAGSNYIMYGSQITSSGGYLESTTPGSWLKLKASSHTGTWYSWNVAEISGTWTDGSTTWGPGAGGGSFVHISGDTMTGTLVAASGVTVATGPLSFTNATNGANTIVAPTGATGALTFKDASGASYATLDTSNGKVVVNKAATLTGQVVIVPPSGTFSSELLSLDNNGTPGGNAITAYGYVRAIFAQGKTAGDHGVEGWGNGTTGAGIKGQAYPAGIGVLGDGAAFNGVGVKAEGGTTHPGLYALTGGGDAIECNGDLLMSGGGDIRMTDGAQFKWQNSTNGQNVMTLPTGQTQGLVINDTSGQWYSHFDTQNQTFNFDVVSGYNADVYFNTGTVHFNGSHLSNIMVIPDSDTDALDVKDTGGTYMMVANTTTKGFAMHGTNTNDGAGSGYVGEHLQNFVYAVSGPTGTASTTPATQTVTSQSLTAGDWMVTGVACIHDVTGGSVQLSLISAISETNNSLGSSVVGLSQVSSFQNPTTGITANADACQQVGPTRVSVASTTTEYVVLKWSGTAAHSCQLYGSIEAWRMR
jgi:hypothetical protein